jgi:hypothetical protein
VNSSPVPDRYEITFGMPRQVLLRLQHVAFYLLLLYAALLTVPLVFHGLGTGLDPSGSFAINHFAMSDYKYGPDIIYNYGPLAFACFTENVGWNLPVALVLRTLVWAVLITELARAYRRQRFAPLTCFLAVLSVIVAQPVLGYLFDYLLASATVLFIIRDHPEAQKFFRGTLPLSMLLSLAFLDKASVYLMLMPGALLFFALTYWREQSKPSRASMLRCGWVAIAPFVAYLVYNPSVTGLWAYITSDAKIIGGYSEAMSTPGLPPDYRRLGTFVVLILGFAVCAVWRKWLKIEVFACVMMALSASIKHGIVSVDHEMFIYGFGLVLFGILVLECRRVKAATVAGAATWALVCILSLAGVNSLRKDLSLLRWNLAPQFERIGKLFHWRESVASMAAQTEANLRADALPDSLLARIHGAPVVVFPWELAYGPANNLNLVPLYTLQSFLSYTNSLDRLTAGHLARTPRDTRLIVEWKSILGRHPLLDVPATWEVIYNGFEGEVALPDILVLKKRDRQTAFAFKTVKHTISDVQQWQNVPDREHAVSVSVAFSRTLLGIARGLFYKIDPVYLDLETDGGERWQFRVVPDVLRYPFVINCLPLDQGGLESLVFGQVCEEKVKRFRFSGRGLGAFSSTAEIAFSEASDARLRFAAGENVFEWESGARGVRFGDRFLLRAARLVPKHNAIRMELDWQSLAEQPLKYSVFVHLLDPTGKMIAQADHEQAPGALTAPRVVKAGENWRSSVQLSRKQLMGVTKIGVGIWEAPGTFFLADRGDRDWDNRRLILPVPKEVSRLVEAPPDSSGPAAATFGEELSMISYSVQRRNGQTVVELRWSALRKPHDDYSVFVHALDSSGGIAFQADHVLRNSSGRTGAWVTGDSVVDSFPVTCPPHIPGGTHSLRIGVYIPKPMKILPVTQTTLAQPSDAWKNQSVLIPNESCR